MFITELIPIAKELAQQPVAFMGGFVSGVLKLNLSEDPLKQWLSKNGYNYIPSEISFPSNKPQNIDID